jgi:hypothetical protein
MRHRRQLSGWIIYANGTTVHGLSASINRQSDTREPNTAWKRRIHMGLFGKSTPPPVPPELPVWLVRSTHDAAENAWAYYQVFRSPRDLAERYGILPWATLPGVKQTASEFMNRDHRMVEVIGVTAGGKWAEWNLSITARPLSARVHCWSPCTARTGS